MSPRLRLAITAVLFSTGGAAIKWCQFGAWQLAGVRAGVACTTLLLLLPETRRGWTWRTVLVGAAYAATTLLYVLSNKLTTAANTIFLQNTAPIFILALAPWLLHEHVKRQDIGYMVALGIGMALFFAGTPRAFATAPNPRLGNLLAATCAVTWALTLIGYRWLVRGAEAGGAPVARAAVCGNLMACLLALAVAVPLAPGRPADWLVVLYLGSCQLGVAYVFFARAVPQVRAIEVSLLLLLEPVLNPLWAWLVHGETPGPYAVLGGAIILAAIAQHAWSARAVPMAVAEP